MFDPHVRGRQQGVAKLTQKPLDCVKFSQREERDLFRLACNAFWEILECEELGEGRGGGQTSDGGSATSHSNISSIALLEEFKTEHHFTLSCRK